jgi:hypothetical protein
VIWFYLTTRYWKEGIMKKYAYDLSQGDVITSLVLDPAENFVVDNIIYDEDNAIVRVEGYTEDTGSEFAFTWGEDKSVTVN